MRTLLLFLAFTFVASAQTPTISPLNPPVNEGGTQTFSCTANCGTGGTWSCSGCAGGINSSTGVYTAPATVTSKQSVGGYQLLPNNHIFNTNISSLPLNSSNTTYVNVVRPVNHINYLASIPINYTTSSTPTVNLFFYYTSANNGSFQMPSPTPPDTEGGWLSALANDNADHHIIRIDTDTGKVQEQYQYYNVGLHGSCPTCNSQSGVKFGSDDYALPANGATDAAGMFLLPLMLHLQEMEAAVASGGTINHALRVTFALGYEASAFIWPATANATDGGTVPFGARARLNSGYDCSVNGAGGITSTIGHILCLQLQQYGLINADGG